MTTEELTALRQAHEAGDLKHADVEALITQNEEQAATIADLEHKLSLAQTWVRTHYKARQKAEQVLARNVAQTIRECAKLARRWPKGHLGDFFPGNKKPDKRAQKLAHLVANGIATRIEQELEE